MSLLGAARSLMAEANPLPFTYYEVLVLIGFLASLWGVGALLQRTPVPPLIGWIIVGIVFGPEVLHAFGPVTRSNMVALAGEIGFWLLVLEAGLELDANMLLEIGLRAFMVALTGFVTSMALTYGIAAGLGFDWKASLAAAVIMGPTSLAVTMSVLGPTGFVYSPTGQLLVTAVAFDDILGLIALAEFKAIADPNGRTIAVPIVVSVGAVIALSYLAVVKMPGWLQRHILPRIPEKYTEGTLLFMLMFLGVALSVAGEEAGTSEYLGLYVAGITFCTVQRLKHVWEIHVRPISTWLIAIFFASTIAFEIPVNEFWSGDVIGSAFAFAVAIFAKLSTGVLARPIKTEWLKVGTAMMARGEYSFVIAIQGIQLGLISRKQSAKVLLAVLLAIFIAPLSLIIVLNRSRARVEKALALAVAGNEKQMREAFAEGLEPIFYRFHLRVLVRFGLLDEVIAKLISPTMELLDIRVQDQGNITSFEAYLKELEIVVDPSNRDLATEQLTYKIGSWMRQLHSLIEHDQEALDSEEETLAKVRQHQQEVLEKMQGHGDTVLGNAACVPLHNLELDRLLTNFRGVVVVPWIPLRVDEEALEEQGTGEANGTQHGDPSIRGQLAHASLPVQGHAQDLQVATGMLSPGAHPDGKADPVASYKLGPRRSAQLLKRPSPTSRMLMARYAQAPLERIPSDSEAGHAHPDLSRVPSKPPSRVSSQGRLQKSSRGLAVEVPEDSWQNQPATSKQLTRVDSRIRQQGPGLSSAPGIIRDMLRPGTPTLTRRTSTGPWDDSDSDGAEGGVIVGRPTWATADAGRGPVSRRATVAEARPAQGTADVELASRQDTPTSAPAVPLSASDDERNGQSLDLDAMERGQAALLGRS